LTELDCQSGDVVLAIAHIGDIFEDGDRRQTPMNSVSAKTSGGIDCFFATPN